MTAARRLELADIALTVLDVLPKPDQRPVFTGWVSHAAGLDADWYDYAVPQHLRNLLARLTRMGLVERACVIAIDRAVLGLPCRCLRCVPYWRLTQAGARFEGTAEDLAQPIRGAR